MRFKVFECCKQTLSLYLFLIFHRSIPLFLGNIRLVSSLATTYSSISGVPPIPLTKASTHSLTERLTVFDGGDSDIIHPSIHPCTLMIRLRQPTLRCRRVQGHFPHVRVL